MLTGVKMTRAEEGIADYFYDEGTNYYFDQGAGGVTVHGKSCRDLMLDDGENISREIFINLLKGHDAAGTKRTYVHKVACLSWAFSAPKSVSILALIPGIV